MVFSDLIEEVKKLEKDEKKELKDILEKILIEERREEMLRNYNLSKKEVDEGSAIFSDDIERLKETL